MNIRTYITLLPALLLALATPGLSATPQETIDHLVQLHATYREVPPDSLGQKDIQAIIETLTEAHELAHTSSYQDHVDLTRMISDITDWLMDMSDTLEPELATAVRSCCSQKCFKCLIVDTLIVRNKAYLPNTGTSSSSGSCAPCSSLDIPNTIALRDSTGSFALNNLSADGNITFNKIVDQSPSGIIYMDGVPALWMYPNSTSLSTLIGGAGNINADYGRDIAIGYQALSNPAYASGTTSDSNIAIGNEALKNFTTGDFNLALGDRSLIDLTSGNNNTALGHSTLVFLARGSGNIVIGRLAGLNYTTSESNNIIIDASGTGALGVTGESGVCRISNINGVNVTGSPVIVSTSNQLGIIVSSKRFKTNITELPATAVEVITKLHPVQFNYLTKDGGAQETISHGLIAEEVAEVDDTLVVYGEDGLPLTVKYHEMDAYYIAALQYVMRELAGVKAQLAAR